ncbi:MAG: hypothetical protein AAF652_15330, partial [Cyanobacteria bacterium P01_C01_bin.72]
LSGGLRVRAALPRQLTLVGYFLKFELVSLYLFHCYLLGTAFLMDGYKNPNFFDKHLFLPIWVAVSLWYTFA